MMASLSSWTDDSDAILSTSCAFVTFVALLYFYQYWTATSKKTTPKTNPKVLHKQMTPIGKFALLSQTERNPSIISFFIALASKAEGMNALTNKAGEGMNREEFEQLFYEALKKYSRLRSHIKDGYFEEATNKSAFLHDSCLEVHHPKSSEEFKDRINKFLTDPIDVTDRPWEINISSGPLGSSGAILNSEELIKQGYKVETVALFRVHHVVCDGVSMSAIVKEMSDEKEQLDSLLLDAVDKYKTQVMKMGVIKRLVGFILYYVLGSVVAISQQLWNMLSSVNPFNAVTDTNVESISKRSVCWKYLAKVDDAKAVAKTIGHHTKLNDLFVALLGRALEKQYQLLEAKSETKPTKCPSSVSIVITAHLTGSILPGQSISNKVGAFVSRIPFNPSGHTSSLSRLGKISKILSKAKRTPAPLISHFITSLISKLGSASLARYALVHTNCQAVAVISNVMGYPFEIHWRSMPIKLLCAFLPLPPKISVGLLVTSYNGQIILSVESADSRVVPDAEKFLDFMLKEYESICLEAANKKE